MSVLVAVILFGFGTVGVLAGPGDHSSIFCYSCRHVTDPTLCTTTERCFEGHCGAEVTDTDGRIEFTLGCLGPKACDHTVGILGKRERGHHDDPVKCRECCSTDHCNKNECSAFHVQHNTVLSTVQIPGQSGTCRDHEEDGFACNLFNKQTICMETDPTQYSYILAHSKCPHYCGFCTQMPTTAVSFRPSSTDSTTVHLMTTTTTAKPVPTVTTTVQPAPACVDDESNGFRCADFDLFHFCTDTTNFAYPLAHEKCPKHCGFCKDHN